MQFQHLLCYWSSKWSPYTCWLVKSAISAPTLSVVLQMVPLYRLTGGKCKSCSKFLKFPYFGHTLQLGHQMVPHTGWLLKWPHFVPTLSLSHRMIPWSPVQRLIVEIAYWLKVQFLCFYVIWLQNGPPYGLKSAVFRHNFANGTHTKLPICWLFDHTFPVAMKWAI